MELKIAIAQMKSKAGDIKGNADKILSYLSDAESKNADLLVLPETCLVGYPCGDLANRPSFIRQTAAITQNIIAHTKGKNCALLFGTLSEAETQDPTITVPQPYNSLVLAHDGKLIAVQHKALLPEYDVFYDGRNFTDAPMPSPIKFKGVKLGLLICNDVWYDEPSKKLADAGAEILIVSNGSPYHEAGKYNDDKLTQRMNCAKKQISATGLPLMFVNAEGGQDDLVFDGQSFILDKNKNLVGLFPAFDNSLFVTDWKKQTDGWQCVTAHKAEAKDNNAITYQALVVGLKDYADKSGFKSAVLGLSGGIDSALVAQIAVQALGAENILGICMPTEFSSEGSLTDSEALAKNLGINCQTISIESLRKDFMGLMDDYTDNGIAGENIQARLRGNILMYIANATGRLLLATGNKSEIAMGYATLYGDMCGGFAPIKDLYKTRVFDLADWVNKHYNLCIPQEILDKPPSAELRPNQRDDDSLPPYDKLDAMLEFLIENNGDWNNVPNLPFTATEVDAVWQQMCKSEYKRNQGVLGSRITAKSFGTGWRMPVAHGFVSEQS